MRRVALSAMDYSIQSDAKNSNIKQSKFTYILVQYSEFSYAFHWTKEGIGIITYFLRKLMNSLFVTIFLYLVFFLSAKPNRMNLGVSESAIKENKRAYSRARVFFALPVSRKFPYVRSVGRSHRRSGKIIGATR